MRGKSPTSLILVLIYRLFINVLKNYRRDLKGDNLRDKRLVTSWLRATTAHLADAYPQNFAVTWEVSVLSI